MVKNSSLGMVTCDVCGERGRLRRMRRGQRQYYYVDHFGYDPAKRGNPSKGSVRTATHYVGRVFPHAALVENMRKREAGSGGDSCLRESDPSKHLVPRWMRRDILNEIVAVST